jgi:large subunit ribosomal protein L21
MYAVIKTGGKQYRVQPGDLLVVEKLEGDVGAEVAFDQVLLVGADDGEVTIGAPVVDGAVVHATLVETRKGDKVKVFKKIRRQGYRRTKGHRQHETVLRVTGLEGAGASAKWDGEVDLTPRIELRARSRAAAQARPDAASVEA